MLWCRKRRRSCWVRSPNRPRKGRSRWPCGAGLQVMAAMMAESVTALCGSKGEHDRGQVGGEARHRSRLGGPGRAANAAASGCSGTARPGGDVPAHHGLGPVVDDRGRHPTEVRERPPVTGQNVPRSVPVVKQQNGSHEYESSM